MSFSEQNRNFFVYEQQRERTSCLLTGEGRSDYIHDRGLRDRAYMELTEFENILSLPAMQYIVVFVKVHKIVLEIDNFVYFH